jgi:hypothetical protein
MLLSELLNTDVGVHPTAARDAQSPPTGGRL